MCRMLRTLLTASAATLAAVTITAQELKFFYPAPSPTSIDVTKDVAYGELRLDLYRPSGGANALPALIFSNLGTGAQRSNPFYKAWAEVAASHGLAAILPDLRPKTYAQDMDAAIAHVLANGASLRIDRDRIAVYAGSGNVSRTLPYVQSPKQTAIKSAVMYYGAAAVTEFRRDLPILFVRAGLDRPPVNRAMNDLVGLATSQNAPVSLLNYSSGHHAFEIVDDADETRDAIDRTIDFVKRTTAPGYHASLKRGLAEATAAAHVSTGSFKEAAAAYGEMVKTRPDDHRLRLSYGEALLGDKQFAAACAELEKLKGKGLGPRDLGVPAARACMQKGDPDLAIAWLQSIPDRFRPRELQKDPIFAPIQERPDFKALFEPR
jgi:dienelactone hydrolase